MTQPLPDAAIAAIEAGMDRYAVLVFRDQALPEARAFLRDLNEHATQRRFVYSHAWRRNDLVMWDNRTTMHRVTRFDASQIRDMRRTTVAGIAA